AYRFAGGGTVGLVAREVQELLARGGGQDLAQIATSADSYVVDQAVSKGTGLTALKRRLGMPEAPVIAIGDSDQDVAMLELAEQWYAPGDRKSTRLNSSHDQISYAVFCLKKKTK